jgi:NAD(P)H-nitrite reductase large subunit
VEAQRGDAHIRLALGDGIIVGAVVMGDQALFFPLQELIEARADIGAIAGELAAPQASIVELVDQAWRNLKACGG